MAAERVQRMLDYHHHYPSGRIAACNNEQALRRIAFGNFPQYSFFGMGSYSVCVCASGGSDKIPYDDYEKI